MYPRFVEVHDGADAMSINVANIEWFAEETISMHNSETRVIESYDELKALIQDCGCLIHKADPRMDMTTPLTIDELKGMVGEPVWNSNNGKWGIVEGFFEWNDSEKSILILYMNDENDEGVEHIQIESNDLIKTPFYRMCK